MRMRRSAVLIVRRANKWTVYTVLMDWTWAMKHRDNDFEDNEVGWRNVLKTCRRIKTVMSTSTVTRLFLLIRAQPSVLKMKWDKAIFTLLWISASPFSKITQHCHVKGHCDSGVKSSHSISFLFGQGQVCSEFTFTADLWTCRLRHPIDPQIESWLKGINEIN